MKRHNRIRDLEHTLWHAMVLSKIFTFRIVGSCVVQGALYTHCYLFLNHVQVYTYIHIAKYYYDEAVLFRLMLLSFILPLLLLLF